MTTVTSDLAVGTRVRIDARSCGTVDCSSCRRGVGSVGTVRRLEHTRGAYKAVVETDDGLRFDFVTEYSAPSDTATTTEESPVTDTAATPEPVRVQPTANTFSDEQQELLREVVGRLGRQHNACAVAAQALRELGVPQAQQTREAVVTITLRVPLGNATGQVQLPDGAPSGYLTNKIGQRTLNDLVDGMLRDAGGRARRADDAKADVVSVEVADTPASAS